MKLKVICQLCGRTQEIDTEKPVGQQPRWDSYWLGDFEIEGLPPVYKDYEVWICDRCHERFLIYTSTVTDEIGETHPDYEWDWEKFKEFLRESLKLQEKDTENSEDNIPLNEDSMLYHAFMATKMGNLSPMEYDCPCEDDEEDEEAKE